MRFNGPKTSVPSIRKRLLGLLNPEFYQRRLILKRFLLEESLIFSGYGKSIIATLLSKIFGGNSSLGSNLLFGQRRGRYVLG